MRLRHRGVATIFTAAAALAATACGDSKTSLSLTSPAGLGGSAAGATISGRVSTGGGVAPSAASTVSPMSTGGITVTVAGTGVSSPVDGLGHFTLTGVPAGTVRVEFSGPAARASVTIAGILGGDRIEIVVSLDGSHATLHSHLVELEGTISDPAGACPQLVFTIGGRRVHTNAATAFNHGSCESIQDASIVEVKGQPQTDGSLLAVSVKNESEPVADQDDDADDDDQVDDDDDQNDRDDDEGDDDDHHERELRGTVSGVSGSCPVLTFLVNGTTIVTSSSTRFEHACSAVQSGRRAEVKGVTQSDGSVLATRVEIDD